MDKHTHEQAVEKPHTIKKVLAWIAIVFAILTIAAAASILLRNNSLNSGEVGIPIFFSSIALALAVWSRIVPKSNSLLFAAAVGVVLGFVLYINFATTTVEDGTDSGSSSQQQNQSDSNKCADDQLLCEQ